MTANASEERPVPESTGTPDPETYNAFVSGITLTGVDLVAVGGERRRPGEAPSVRFDLSAGFQCEGRTISYRFDGVGHLTDNEGADYGEVRATVIVSVSATTEPDPACVEMFGATSAAMMAHPYLRETLATTALRLGFPGVLLPALIRTGEEPAGAEAAGESH